MKHIFIVNPAAGNGRVPEVVQRSVAGRPDCEIHITSASREATAYIRARCAQEPEEQLCFVACGGDGTINEVASGVVCCPNACMTVYALGSGNDFVKIFGGKESFQDVDALLQAVPHPVDVLQVNERWCVNAFHFGLDSAVARTMNQVKTKPIIGGSRAYATGVVKALINSMRTYCRIRVDGEPFYDGDLLLCTVANGQYVGGSYRCAPRSLPDDGLAEICLVKPVSRIAFLRMQNSYKQGTHLEDPRMKDLILYRRGRLIEVDAKPGFCASLDGEIQEECHFRVEVLPKKLPFAAVNAAKAAVV